MQKFDEIYGRLNSAQRHAVDTIYGPVLVLAGPGTGKTQLLSARVSHILRTTDTLPQNILCLTFTETGAANMRQRLTRFIGPQAYDVQIGTYHAFGRTVIARFPEYFTDIRLERPIDKLGQHQILSRIIDDVEYRSPIKQVRHHLGDLVSTISEVKRALLTPDDLRHIAADNLDLIKKTAESISQVLAPYTARMPGRLSVSRPLFESILAILQAAPGHEVINGPIQQYAVTAVDNLERALAEAEVSGKTTPLTRWKNKWLVKNSANQFVLAGELESRRIAALATVLEQYQTALSTAGLYDFDDMILQAIEVLEANDDLRYTLQEQYQFILLDEFQDTNAAQLRLVQLLTDNPAHEGKPNVLAVGDDDQAIYAFQGAEYSNMLDFFNAYRDVTVISLSDNYRSQAAILELAGAITNQIESRLHNHMPGFTKQLSPRAAGLEPLVLERREYQSEIAERAGIANEVKNLIGQGVKPSEIAILAPKHRYLEPIVPYLQDLAIPVTYEKRENILDTPVVRQVLTMADLVLAIAQGRQNRASNLWVEVLSYDFWEFSTAEIWQLSWQANDERKTWSEALLGSPVFRHAALLILTLAGRATTDTCESLLDALIGSVDVQTHDTELPSVRSPLRDYYFKRSGDTILFETVTQLTVLREKLKDHQASRGSIMTLSDLLDFVEQYRMADEQMLNTSPYNQSTDAVQLMTVFKAKGLEFTHVFLPTVHNDVWGSASGSMGNKLTLPANLAPIRHAGATEDERLRLFYVALTRAKSGLHLTSHAANFAGKVPPRLKYLDEVVEDDHIITRTFPQPHQNVAIDDTLSPSIDTIMLDWRSRHLEVAAVPLKTLLQNRLDHFQLSPTHLTQFLDLKHSGPESFLLNTLLRFPGSPSVDLSFGNAMHHTLEWLQNELNKNAVLPTDSAAIDYALNYLQHEPLTETQVSQQSVRAQNVLAHYLLDKRAAFKQHNIAEKSFRGEGVFVGQAHLSGKVDLLEIDQTAKKITVVDYKTGSLGNDPQKLHRYTIQLYCYKLLVEASHTYAGYSVEEGRLVFVEPDTEGAIIEKKIQFEAKETERIKALLRAVWQRVKDLDMPDVSSYGDTLRETLRFEDDLIATTQVQ